MGQTSSSPFTYTPEAAPERGYSGVGQLFQAKKTTATGKACAPVSVFVLQDDKGKSEVYAREIKRLRSPDLIKFIDRQVVGDKIWLVTEAVVPLEAVHDVSTTAPWVLVLDAKGVATKVPVTLGARGLEVLEVLEGLADGAVVVTDSAIKPGAHVRTP